MKEKSGKEKKDVRKFISLIVMIIIMTGIAVCLIPFIQKMTVEANRDALIEWIRAQGAWGVFILLGMQILQVIIAVIPGEVVEVAAGILYGPIGGYLICTVGVILSSSLVFFMVRRLGRDFVEDKISKKNLAKFKFLHDSNKLKMVVFILFLIPGTPKDMLTYVVPLTTMKASHFLLLSALARIPSILSSTYAGFTIDKGNFGITILVFVLTGALGILGILLNDKILTKMHQHGKKG